MRTNPRLRIGRYNQHFVDTLSYDESAVDYLRRLHNDLTYQMARNLLGKFGLEGHAHTIKLRSCSGGQKARVVFAQIYLQKPHVRSLTSWGIHLLLFVSEVWCSNVLCVDVWCVDVWCVEVWCIDVWCIYVWCVDVLRIEV